MNMQKKTLSYSYALAELSLQGIVSVYENLSIALILKPKSDEQADEFTFERREYVT